MLDCTILAELSSKLAHICFKGDISYKCCACELISSVLSLVVRGIRLQLVRVRTIFAVPPFVPDLSGLVTRAVFKVGILSGIFMCVSVRIFGNVAILGSFVVFAAHLTDTTVPALVAISASVTILFQNAFTRRPLLLFRVSQYLFLPLLLRTLQAVVLAFRYCYVHCNHPLANFGSVCGCHGVVRVGPVKELYKCKTSWLSILFWGDVNLPYGSKLTKCVRQIALARVERQISNDDPLSPTGLALKVCI
mmetsp:Transcript_12173/g.37112  ORF Transcript_12173/g.37112 Transcript_12173/m.37112 type:complete len:249 (+) Transcript_12173:1268-2014(+)